MALLPLGALFYIAINGTIENNSNNWQHLIQYVLPPTALDTMILLTITAIGTSAIGITSAWLTTIYNFPARKFFSWALITPLAIPPYIAAYAMVEFNDKIKIINLESLTGAAFVFSMVLYPYVYLITRISFARQKADCIEVARTLSAGTNRIFWQIALPVARPAIIIGIALVMMETLNDIGAVEYLGIRTITFAVFETWLNRGDLTSAVQLSIFILFIIALLIAFERKARRQHKTNNEQIKNIAKHLALIELSPIKKIIAFIFCASIVAIGFIIPTSTLGSYVIARPEQIFEKMFEPIIMNAAFNSFLVGIFTSIVTVAIAFFIFSIARLYGKTFILWLARAIGFGYAIPSTILAIGLLYPLTHFDNFISEWLGSFWNFGLLFSGTAFIVVYGCSVRFLTIACGHVESGFTQLSKNVDMAARVLGKKPNQITYQIHLPILKNVLAIAALFVFVDSCKELSATLILRPLAFETLATLVYDKASQAIIEEGAMAACYIILLGLLPIIWLGKDERFKI